MFLSASCAVLLSVWLSASLQQAQRGINGGIYVPSPVVGTWVADLSRSKLGPKSPFASITLEIIPAGDTVTLASTLMTKSGEKRSAAEKFPTAGAETPGTLSPGVTLLARWLGPYVLATLASKDGKPFVLVFYEASADGATLTSRSSGLTEEVVVFTRK
jgi:hypothetical protein